MKRSIRNLYLEYLVHRRWLPVLFVFTIGLCLSLLLFGYAYRFEQNRLEAEFEEMANQPVAEINASIQTSLSSVHSLVAFFDSSEFVDRQEFNKFATSILTWNTSIQALEWLPRVASNERELYEMSAWKDGLSGYRITEKSSDGRLVPASARPEFFPVFYAEPLEGNEAALGFDVMSEPTRLATLARARKTGTIAVSDAISLVQSIEKDLGVLVAAPVFDMENAPGAETGHSRHLHGFVLVVLNIPKLVGNALAPWAQDATFGDIYLFSDPEGERQELLFAQRTENSALPVSVVDVSTPFVSKHIHVGDQQWQVLVTLPQNWPTLYDLRRPLALLIVLLGLTVAATAIYRLRQLGLMEQERLAASLKEKNESLENASMTLAKYLPPQVWNAVLSENNPRFIGAKRKHLTIFFGDIVGFTNLSQEMSPEKLTYILNDFFSEMADIGERYGATLDKFAGDAVIMFFGDPISQGCQQDAASCVQMAIEMQKRMVELRERWIDLGYPHPFHLRIGIHSGECNVGNFGSSSRMSYTIVGLDVNLAARIEKLGMPDGVTITKETHQLLGEQFDCVPFRHVHVRGVDREVELFSVAA